MTPALKFLFLLTPLAVLATEPAPGMALVAEADPGQAHVLDRYLQVGKSNVVRGATMVARFAGKLPKLGKEATLQAKRVVLQNGTVEYDVLGREGDRTVQKDLIARYMGAEVENSLRPTEEFDINAENYKFKPKGVQNRDGMEVQVIELNPRKKKAGLFKGEIWLDKETGLTLCEKGRFVKSPSVFLKKVEFTRKFEIKDGKSVPLMLHTSIQTRFWGKAELRVDYSDVQFNAEQSHKSAQRQTGNTTEKQDPPNYMAN